MLKAESKLQIINLKGFTSYESAHNLQLETVIKRKNNEIDDTLILLEHKPVITLGKNASKEGVLVSEETLRKQKIELHRIERGGQATYHAPGQLVGYPIINLHQIKSGVAKFVNNLETVMINVSKKLGVPAKRIPGLTGIFADIENSPKIGALGIRVTNGITFHGFALNIDMNLQGYNLINPCGLQSSQITSIAKITGQKYNIEKVKDITSIEFKKVFNYKQ
ncbi:MAG: lipoyl(octanoyl) transferase LipB [Deltaproteobacteria bacterium]|nr:lipoyl(octanoyl) transferase LipB [Deltaproteobacteria bacterium]